MQHPQPFLGIITRESFKDLNLMRSSFKCLRQVSSTGSAQKKEKCLFENLTSGQQEYNGKQELTSQQKGRADYNVLVCDTIETQAMLQHSLGCYELVKARKKNIMVTEKQDVKSWGKSFKCSPIHPNSCLRHVTQKGTTRIRQNLARKRSEVIMIDLGLHKKQGGRKRKLK